MKKSEGGLNEAVPTGSTTGIPNGSACVQSFAKKHGTKIHLYNIDNGKVPTFNEVCGRSSISGIHNQESMGGNFIMLHEADAHHGQGRLLAQHPHDRELCGHRRVRQAGQPCHLHDDREVAATT
ncbi:hypothetical protein [Streptomyces sp. NPDC029004]|uniref:hypothetical protein n=1 Tax=Streptomyces sp. NPDC029004 TaxID=3154490 RepID=UPI0033EF2BA6